MSPVTQCLTVMRPQMLAALCILLVAPEVLARPGSQHMQDLHFLARQVAACYAEGKMAFGQRVLHRRFVESFLAECEATPADKRAIDAAFAAPSGEACTLSRFFDIKERLSFERSRGHC